MFGIGSTELLVILVVALIVLGPKSLASVSRTLGKAVGEFRRVTTDFQRTLNVEAAEEEARARREAAAKEAQQKTAPSAAGASNPADNNTSKWPSQSPLGFAANQESSEQNEAAGPPADSPLGQAIAKARAQAAASDKTMSDEKMAPTQQTEAKV